MRATFAAVAAQPTEGETWRLAAETPFRALQGFGLSALAGGMAGIAAGNSPATMRFARPLVAWIVLAMIWFGATDGTVVMTVAVGALPALFAGAAEGVAAHDRGLDAMAEAFSARPLRRFLTVGLRQLLMHLFPALILGLGSAFKVAVMAELLANAGGIGGAPALARANLDFAEAPARVSLALRSLALDPRPADARRRQGLLPP